jgi:O-6-methylguanine DNA methyltransferase
MNTSISKIKTPIGDIIAAASDKGICLLGFEDSKNLSSRLDDLQATNNSSPLLSQLKKELKEYFSGQRTNFDVPLDMDGTEFQKKAWQSLVGIPYGQTVSYYDQASDLGNNKAVRAVARANSDNKIAIIIPCHRVIAKNGKISGYAGGVWRKEYLLSLESKNINKKSLSRR